ncbi:MAG: class I SAM-dependent methyltransferase [Actinobacteria bacterium]|nr:class I SAM-dependent methyltransferase [Actinomycetota bacterium]
MPDSELKNQLSFNRVLKCRLCSSTDLSIFFKLPDTPFGDRYLPPGKGASDANLIPLEVMQCHNCNNFQTSVVVDTSSMYEHYLSRPGAVNNVLSGAYKEYAEHLSSLLDLSSKDLVVEIGSNDGLFISTFAERGIRCLGVDPAKNLTEVAKGRGITTISTFFDSEIASQIVESHGKAKLVVANMVVANVPTLENFFTGIATILDRDGIFAMETNYVLDVIANQQLEVINHEHITYFSVTTLSKFLQNFNLEIFWAKRVPAKSGALRVYVRHRSKSTSINDSVVAAKEFEECFGLFSPTAWGAISKNLEHQRDIAKNYFSNLQSTIIAGYGTSIGATTLLYALDIGPYFHMLIDDDEFRQGLESPGLGLPVLSRESMYAKAPSVGVSAILAPRYVGQILDKNQVAISKGIKFFRVWPNLERVPNSLWDLDRPKD